MVVTAKSTLLLDDVPHPAAATAPAQGLTELLDGVPRMIDRASCSARLYGRLPTVTSPAAAPGPGSSLTNVVCDRARWIFGYRADQLAKDPSAAPWITRAAVSELDGAVVGDAGFHGPPDEAGLVEVGYTVVPGYRRQGYARAMLRALLVRAAAEPGVMTVRARIGSDNTASLATIAGFGFTRVGEQGNERDGLAIVFEVPADAIQAKRRTASADMAGDPVGP